MPDLPHLQWLITWATDAGAPTYRLKAAADELIDLIERPEPDRRRIATLTRGRRIEQLRALGLTRAEVCERLDISTDQYDRANRAARDSRGSSTVELRASQKE